MTYIIRPYEKSVVKGELEDERPVVGVAYTLFTGLHGKFFGIQK